MIYVFNYIKERGILLRSIDAWEKAMTIEETIYPKNCFYIGEKEDFKTPYHVIKNELKNKNLTYFSLTENFIKKQDDLSQRRGADLPYIGENYFTNKEGTRVMMVTQDSDAPSAGSIVFLGPLLEERYTREEYKRIKNKCNKFLKSYQFNAGSYSHALETFDYWNIDISYLYLTDARKVHLLNGGGFDEQESLNMIINEIKAVDPHIIVAAGDIAYNLLRELTECEFTTTNGKVVFHIMNKPVVRAPFFIGRGRQGNFDEKSKRTKITLEALIKHSKRE